jgi:hypothetical protein
VLVEVDQDPRFAALYRLVRLRDPKTGQPALCCYARADWLDAGADGLPWDLAPVPPRPRPPEAPVPPDGSALARIAP